MSPQKKPISENVSYLVVALLISLILWVAILGSKEIVTAKDVPTDYILPEQMMITNNLPEKIRFRIAGPQLKLKKFGDLKEPLILDLTSRAEGKSTITLHSESIPLIPGLRVIAITPSLISINLERIVSKVLPIEVVSSGQLGSHKKRVRFIAEPSQITVEGARSAVAHLTSVQTEPINLEKVEVGQEFVVGISLKDPLIKKGSDEKIKVRVVVE